MTNIIIRGVYPDELENIIEDLTEYMGLRAEEIKNGEFV